MKSFSSRGCQAARALLALVLCFGGMAYAYAANCAAWSLNTANCTAAIDASATITTPNPIIVKEGVAITWTRVGSDPSFKVHLHCKRFGTQDYCKGRSCTGSDTTGPSVLPHHDKIEVCAYDVHPGHVDPHVIIIGSGVPFILADSGLEIKH